MIQLCIRIVLATIVCFFCINIIYVCHYDSPHYRQSLSDAQYAMNSGPIPAASSHACNGCVSLTMGAITIHTCEKCIESASDMSCVLPNQTMSAVQTKDVTRLYIQDYYRQSLFSRMFMCDYYQSEPSSVLWCLPYHVLLIRVITFPHGAYIHPIAALLFMILVFTCTRTILYTKAYIQLRETEKSIADLKKPFVESKEKEEEEEQQQQLLSASIDSGLRQRSQSRH